MSAKKVRIVEVGPRDGLQNEAQVLPLEVRIEFIRRLAECGLSVIEVGAFVSPKWVPQMADTAPLFESLKQESFFKKISLPVLVPNLRGLDDALAVGVKEIAIFASASDGFAQKNINCSVRESLERYAAVVKRARASKLRVRAYLSVAFGCPFDGEVKPTTVLKLSEQLLSMGAYEVSIGDTIGVAHPRQVADVLKVLFKKISPKKLALHFHDTRGTAVANVIEGARLGIRCFDSSLGGLGGCPYAPGSQGNVATEDIVFALQGYGLQTGVNLKKMFGVYQWMQQQMNKPLPGRVGRAGVPEWQYEKMV